MIEKLTKSQENKIPVYLKKWLDRGHRTKTVDREKANDAINFLYEKIMKIEKPKYIIHLDSPMACQIAANLLKDTKFDSSQLDSQLYSQLYSQLDSQLDSQLGSQLRSQLGSQLRSQLGSQLGSQLYSQLDSQLGSQKLTYYSYVPSLLWWPGWTGFYDLVLNELFPKKKEQFELFNELTTHWSEAHYYLLFPQIVFVSDYPKEINLNAENRLHKDGGAALLYRDGYGLYRLNGTNVPKEIAETPANKITKEMVLKEENADIRREVIRKIGLEKTIKLLGADTTDTFETKTGGKYELLMIDYDKRGKRPYLKMKCSSSSEVFILGVKPGITTAKDALTFLNNGHSPDNTNVIWEA